MITKGSCVEVNDGGHSDEQRMNVKAAGKHWLTCQSVINKIQNPKHHA